MIVNRRPLDTIIGTVTKKATEGEILTMRFHKSFLQAFRVLRDEESLFVSPL